MYLALPLQNIIVNKFKFKNVFCTAKKIEFSSKFNLKENKCNIKKKNINKNNVINYNIIPTYRLATTILRRNNLTLPVLEKTVILRIANNALCLYNWLYFLGYFSKCIFKYFNYFNINIFIIKKVKNII